MTYEDGWKQAQLDFANNLFPMATRGFPKPYRDGYSDGYWAATGGVKK